MWVECAGTSDASKAAQDGLTAWSIISAGCSIEYEIVVIALSAGQAPDDRRKELLTAFFEGG